VLVGSKPAPISATSPAFGHVSSAQQPAPAQQAQQRSGNGSLKGQHPGYWKTTPISTSTISRTPTPPRSEALCLSRAGQVGGRRLTWGGITLRLPTTSSRRLPAMGTPLLRPIENEGTLAPYYGRLERAAGVHGPA